MSNKFKQSRLALRIEAEILKSGLRYVERDVFRSFERIVPFDQIIDAEVRFYNVNRLYLLISVGLISIFVLRCHGYLVEGSVTLGAVAWAGMWALAASLGTWMRAGRYIGFHAGGGGVFFFDRSGQDDPRPFLERIALARNQFLEQSLSRQEQFRQMTESQVGVEAPASNGGKWH